MPRYDDLRDLPAELRTSLAAFVSDLDGDTFVLSGLPPELSGGVLARYSRAKSGLRLTLANEFLDARGIPSAERGSALMDRVLNAFGDDSVGELEGMHAGLEDLSQLCAKLIEDRRIGGSPIEQSTRYVVYDHRDETGRWRYLRPEEIMTTTLGPRYLALCDRAFALYTEAVGLLGELFRSRLPASAFTIVGTRNGQEVRLGQNELSGDDERKAFRTAHAFTVRCAALDVARGLLPASTLTQLGLFGNGRYFTHLLSALKSSPLSEANTRAASLERELGKVLPTFIKRNAADPQLSRRDTALREQAEALAVGLVPETTPVTLLPSDALEHDILAAALYPESRLSLRQLRELVATLPAETRESLLGIYLGQRPSRRRRSGRALEAGYPLTFDLLATFAEYRDLQRHRVLTQQRQHLSPELGFSLPPDLGEVGLESKTSELVAGFEDLHADVRRAVGPEAAQYVTLFNHRLRFLLGMNLREFQHLAELRTQPAGHHGYRALVQDMVRAVVARYPFAAACLEHVDWSDPGERIARQREQGRLAGRLLERGLDPSLDL